MGRHIYSGYSDHHDDGDDPYGQSSGNGYDLIDIFDRGRLLRGSFDGKRSTFRNRRNYPHARGFSRCRRELTDDAVRVINLDELGCPRLDRCPRWVKVRNIHPEWMFSALPPNSVIARRGRYFAFVPEPIMKRGHCDGTGQSAHLFHCPA
jgi:hypothetical protein